MENQSEKEKPKMKIASSDNFNGPDNNIFERNMYFCKISGPKIREN